MSNEEDGAVSEAFRLFSESLAYSEKPHVRKIGECMEDWLKTARKVQSYLAELETPRQGESFVKHLQKGREAFMNHAFAIGELLEALKGA